MLSEANYSGKSETEYEQRASPERVSGLPNPQLYDQYYINKYSFPKGLIAVRKED